MIFSGTAVTYGRGRAVVVATGMQTEMGRIAGMLKDDAGRDRRRCRRSSTASARVLGLVVVVIAVVMIATIIVVEHVRGFSALFDVLILGVALAVAAVPEGLPAVVTAVLSIGVQRMARRNAIVRHLAAVETLGSANVIASDKTGTLTKNEMTVRAVVTASGRVRFGGTGYAPEGEVQPGGRRRDRRGAPRSSWSARSPSPTAPTTPCCSERDGRWTVQGDPTEGALIVAARKAGLEADALDARFARVGEVPFSSERKLMSTVHTDAERQERLLVFTKGAPDVLLARCTHELVGEDAAPLTAERRAEIREGERRAGRASAAHAGRRLPLAPDGRAASGRGRTSASSRISSSLGLIGMIDPPRDEAKEAVARAQSARASAR